MATDETFERKKVCYEQNFQQARSLNEQMNRVPTIAITLTGGLWFGAALTQGVDSVIRFGLLLFAVICNVVLILACFRIRDVFESYLERIKAFDPDSFVTGQPAKPKLGSFGSYSMISVYCSLMGAAALLSLIGALAFYWPFAVSRSWAILTLVFLVIAVLVLIRRGVRGSPS